MQAFANYANDQSAEADFVPFVAAVSNRQVRTAISDYGLLLTDY
jgi:hypothetical protein